MSRSLRVLVSYIPQVRLALRRNGYISQRILAEELGFSQSTVSNFLTGKPVDFSYFTEISGKLSLLWRDIADLELPSDTDNDTLGQEHNFSQSSKLEQKSTLKPSLEYPEGQVPLFSPFYVERTPIEVRCYEEIQKPGSLIRIKAPQQMGKSSLLARILQEVETMGDVTVTVDFQLAEERFFDNLNTFLRWFCDTLIQEITLYNQGLQQKLLHQLDEHWALAQRIGSMKACKDYFERFLFPEIKQPLISCPGAHP